MQSCRSREITHTDKVYQGAHSGHAMENYSQEVLNWFTSYQHDALTGLVFQKIPVL
jgi:hypothetical protein